MVAAGQGPAQEVRRRAKDWERQEMQHDRMALTHELASALWRSAARSRGDALHHWLAAEQMVAESLAGMRRREGAEAACAARRVAGSLASSAFPVEQVRDLARCFWTRSGRPRHQDLDFWLAAERHVQRLCEATLAGHSAIDGAFSASAHWTRIRDRAERLWLAGGRRQGRDLDTWLRAEAEILAELAAAADPGAKSAASSLGSDTTVAVGYMPATATTEVRPTA